MSRKQRKRKPRPRTRPDKESAAVESASVEAKPARKSAPRVSSPDQRPPAPWGNLPLAELVILAGIIALVVGVAIQEQTWIGAGIVLAGFGGLEVAAREHFAGYRSHSSLLAGFVAIVVAVGLFYLADQVIAVCLGAAVGVFLVFFYLARRAFQRASGGLSFRVGGMRG